MPKTIVLLFGEMGSGKSFLAKRLAKKLNLVFFEGDSILPGEMIAKTSKFQAPTKQMLKNLVFTLKSSVTWIANSTDHGLVVSQALYRNEHREEFIEHCQGQGFAVVCYWVRTSWWTNLKQLWSRPKGMRWILYWLMNKPWFQTPTHQYVEWRNTVRAEEISP